MNNFSDNINNKSREISKKEIGTQGEALRSQQEALNQFQAIQSERRNNLLMRKQENMAAAQQLDIMAQAATVGTGTMGTLQKYGMKSPPKIQSSTIKTTPNKITINNNTTNNVVNGGGGGENNPGKFKAWLNRTLAIQKEETNKRNLDYEKRESRLAKSASRMLSRVEDASKSVAETLNPQKIGTSIGNQFRILLMLFGMKYLSGNFARILPAIERSVNFLQEGFGAAKEFFNSSANYFGFTEEGHRLQKQGEGFYNDLVRFIGGEPGKKGKSTLLDVGMIWVEEFGKMLDMKFKHMMELRGEAIKSIKFPALDLGNIGGTLSQLAGYLGNILTALVDPNSAMHSSIRSNIKTIGLSSTMNNSKKYNYRHKTFSKNTDWGEADVTYSSNGKKNYSLHRDYLTAGGDLTGSTASQVSQGRDILGALNQVRETGQIDTARLASGLQRINDQVSKRGVVTLDPEFVNRFYSPSELRQLIQSGNIVPKKYKYVKVKRTAGEKSSEEQAHGFFGGGVRAYAGKRIGDAAEDYVPFGGNYLANKALNNGGVTRFSSGYANAVEKLTGLIPVVGDIHKSLNTGVVTATGAIEGGINNLIANDYTLKLVPANDNSYGPAVKTPSGKPFFVDLYSLNKTAIDRLAQSNFGTNFSLDSEASLKKLEDFLVNYGGGSKDVEERFLLHQDDIEPLFGDEKAKSKTIDLNSQFRNVRNFDSLKQMHEAEENALWKKSAFNKFGDNSIGVANEVIGGINYGIRLAKNKLGEYGVGSFVAQSNGSWEGATPFGFPSPAVDSGLKFDVKRASDSAIKLSSVKLYDSNGNLTKYPHPSKGSSTSTGHCAGYVRRAIADGLGLSNSVFYGRLKGRTNAKDYVSTLGQFGFKALSWNNYTPRVGDVLVIGPSVGHPYGHICIKSQRGWVSDYIQSDMWGSETYRNNRSGVVFRHLHVVSSGITEDDDLQDASDIYTEALFDAEGNVMGYKASDGTKVNTKGNFLTDEELGRVSSSASMTGYGINRDWAMGSQFGFNSTASDYLIGKDQSKVGSVIIKSLVDRLGLTPEQAAGVVGNLVAESGLGVGTYKLGKLVNDGGVSAAGLAQWRGSRLEALQNLSKLNGKDWGSLEAQIDFLVHELKTSHSGVLTKLKNSKTVEESARIFGHDFERFAGYDNPNDSNYYKRIGAANGILENLDLKNSEVYRKELQEESSKEKISKLKLRSDSLKDGIKGKKVACVGDSWMCGLLGLDTSNVTKNDRTGVEVSNPNNPLFNKLKEKGASDCVGFARCGARIEDNVSYVIQILSSKPDVIIVHVGLNNHSDEHDSIVRAYRKVLGAASGIPIFFCTVNYAPSIKTEYIDNVNKSLSDSGVNILNVTSNNLTYADDKLHLSNYTPFADLIVKKLVEGAPNYKVTNNEIGVGVYTSTETFDKDGFKIPEISVMSEEERKKILQKGTAAEIFGSSTLLKNKFSGIGEYGAFEKSYMSLTDEQKEIYRTQKAAENFWNSLDEKHRHFDFFPGGYKSFEELFVKLTDNERSKLISDMSKIVEYNKQLDKVNKSTISKADKEALILKNTSDIVDNNFNNGVGSGENRFGRRGSDYWKRVFGESIINPEDTELFYRLLRSGNIDGARALVEKHINENIKYLDEQLVGEGNANGIKNEIKEHIFGQFNKIAASILSSDHYNSLNSELQDSIYGVNTKNLNEYQIGSLGMDAEKLKFTQQYLTNGLFSTNSENTSLQNLNILNANKKLTDINKELGGLLYYYDPEKGTGRLAEYLRNQILSGDLDEEFANNRIYSESAVNKYISGRESETKKKVLELLAKKKAIQDSMTGDKKSVESWYNNVSNFLATNNPEKINLTVDEYLRNNSDKLGLSLDSSGNVIFNTESERKRFSNMAASELIKSGKLDSFLYMQLNGLGLKGYNGNDLITEQDLLSGKSRISRDANGNLMLDGKLESSIGDQSSSAWRDAMLRDQSLGLMMSSSEFNMQKPVMPNRSDYIKKKKKRVGGKSSLRMGYQSTFDKAGYDAAMAKYNSDLQTWNRIQKLKNSSVGANYAAATRELHGRLMNEEIARLRASGESGFTLSANEKTITEGLLNSMSETERDMFLTNLNKSGLSTGDTVTEVKTNLAGGGTITRFIDSKGNTIYTLVPENVVRTRNKAVNTDKYYNMMGFSAKEASERKAELDAATIAYQNRQIELEQKGLDIGVVNAAAQNQSYDQIAEIFKLSRGENGGLRVTMMGENLNEKAKTPDETKN